MKYLHNWNIHTWGSVCTRKLCATFVPPSFECKLRHWDNKSESKSENKKWKFKCWEKKGKMQVRVKMESVPTLSPPANSRSACAKKTFESICLNPPDYQQVNTKSIWKQKYCDNLILIQGIETLRMWKFYTAIKIFIVNILMPHATAVTILNWQKRKLWIKWKVTLSQSIMGIWLPWMISLFV